MHRLLLLSMLGFLTLSAGLRADSIATKPDFIDALPLADTPDGVRVTIPFLANAIAVVPAGSTLRLFYVRPTSYDKDAKVVRTGDSRQAAYSRQSANDTPIYVSSELQAVLKNAQNTVWPNLASFRASLNLINSNDLRLVYKAPSAADLSDESFGMIEGLLLGEKDGAVLVLATANGSTAQSAGLAAGDRIDALNGTELKGSLAAFQQKYNELRSAATIGTQKPYLFHVRHAGQDTPADITLRPPPSLSGSLLDQ